MATTTTMNDVIKTRVNEKDQKRLSISKDDRLKKLETVVKGIRKTYGDESIQRMSGTNIPDFPCIATTIPTVDAALGIGGFPKGRIVEIFGLNASGKTTLSLLTVAEAQRTGHICAFVDAEHALDPGYASRELKVNLDELLISQPSSGEEALEITEALIDSGNIDVIVVDSVAALVPRAELEGEMGDAHMGIQARLMGQAMRKLTAKVAKSNVLLIFLNQQRATMNKYSPLETPGGAALKFFASVRLEIAKSSAIKDKNGPIGHITRVKIVKNKVAPPFKTATYNFYYGKGKGVDFVENVIEGAILANVLERQGNSYFFAGNKVGGSKPATIDAIKENQDLYNSIKDSLMNKAKSGELTGFDSTPEDDDSEEKDTTDSAVVISEEKTETPQISGGLENVDTQES